MSSIDTIKTWHSLVHNRDMHILHDLLADEVVFHSPVVHTPQKGKAINALHQAMASMLQNLQTRSTP